MSIFQVVTDDDYFPWKVLRLKNDDCINLLEELPRFEYFIFDDLGTTVLTEAEVTKTVNEILEG